MYILGSPRRNVWSRSALPRHLRLNGRKKQLDGSHLMLQYCNTKQRDEQPREIRQRVESERWQPRGTRAGRNGASTSSPAGSPCVGKKPSSPTCRSSIPITISGNGWTTT